DLLKDVTTTLADVQTKLLELVTCETILVGHSLEHDFKACKIVHGKVIDTSVLYPHPRGGPYKNSLNFLVKSHLRREMDRKAGHCSIDDATACMDLVLLKLTKGGGAVGEGGEGSAAPPKMAERYLTTRLAQCNSTAELFQLGAYIQNMNLIHLTVGLPPIPNHTADFEGISE
ncbi:hypothetical protein T484DRAFT_1811738, partial [Baffinella frigidus]